MNWELKLNGSSELELKRVLAALASGASGAVAIYAAPELHAAPDAGAVATTQEPEVAQTEPVTQVNPEVDLLDDHTLFMTATSVERAVASVLSRYQETKTVGVVNGRAEKGSVLVLDTGTATVHLTTKKAVVVIRQDGLAMVLQPEAIRLVVSDPQTTASAPAGAAQITTNPEDRKPAEDGAAPVTAAALRELGGKVMELNGSPFLVATIEKVTGKRAIRELDSQDELDKVYAAFTEALALA